MLGTQVRFIESALSLVTVKPGVHVWERLSGPGFAVPFGLGVVDLDEGWSMLATLVGERLAPIGAPVEVTWIERAGRLQPAFAEVAP